MAWQILDYCVTCRHTDGCHWRSVAHSKLAFESKFPVPLASRGQGAHGCTRTTILLTAYSIVHCIHIVGRWWAHSPLFCLLRVSFFQKRKSVNDNVFVTFIACHKRFFVYPCFFPFFINNSCSKNWSHDFDSRQVLSNEFFFFTSFTISSR